MLMRILWLMKIFGKRYVLLGWLALFVIRRLRRRQAQRRVGYLS